MAKSELFKIPILGPILPKVCAFPVKRGVPDRQALRTALELLAQGQVVTIFPEGTRSPDGTLQKPELGVALIALRSGAPVVPVGISGSDRLLPRGSPIPRFAHVTVRIGKPLYFPQEDVPTHTVREKIAEQIMSSLSRLIDQEH
jgi:1-acyl-sn-glycerol-3-phosphate acyltransferase